MAAWLRHHAGMTPNSAKTLTFTARGLRDLPYEGQGAAGAVLPGYRGSRLRLYWVETPSPASLDNVGAAEALTTRK